MDHKLNPGQDPLKFFTLRDLLEQKGGRKRAGDLSLRIRVRGIWASDAGEPFSPVSAESEWGRQATRLIQSVIRYDADLEIFGTASEDDPLGAAEGPWDPYLRFGWPRDELLLPVEVAPRKATAEETFKIRIQPCLEKLESLLEQQGYAWTSDQAVPGTIAEFREFVGWLDPELVGSMAEGTFRKKCKTGRVVFKVGRPRREEDEAGNTKPVPISPLGKLLERNGLRSQRDLQPSASDYL